MFIPFNKTENYQDYVAITIIPPGDLLQVRSTNAYDDTMISSLQVHHKYNYVQYEMLHKTYMSGQVDHFPKVLQIKCKCNICLHYKLIRVPMSVEINDYSLYPPDSFLFIDFSFYNITSIRGFKSVLDIICVSTHYSFAFIMRCKQPPIIILKWLFAILRKEDKIVRIVRIDEDGELACLREFCKLIVDNECSL